MQLFPILELKVKVFDPLLNYLLLYNTLIKINKNLSVTTTFGWICTI